jgi:putative endonuclease
MSADPRHKLGRAAEDVAARYLRKAGLRVLNRNVSTRRGEVDIIAADGEVLCFVEVKCRESTDFAPPMANVTRGKQARIRAAARAYLAARRLQDRLCRFDVVSVTPDPEARSGWHVEHIRDAF